MGVLNFIKIDRDKCYPLYGNGRFQGVIVMADVEEVVRCRDCLHHKPLEILEGGHICEVFNWQSREYDFCSFAERRTMSRYIDAEELCRNNFMCDCKYGCCDYCYKTQQQKIDCEYYSTYSRMDFCQWIAETPTANVCEVIPCGECIYAKPYNKKWRLPINENLLWCEHHNEEKEPNWFCADAIERTVEDEQIH